MADQNSRSIQEIPAYLANSYVVDDTRYIDEIDNRTMEHAVSVRGRR
jgi:hypothetical protein